MRELIGALWQHAVVHADDGFPSMHCTTEFSIELSDQDLAGLHDSSVSAQRKHAAAATAANEYDLIEIELTPEEMDALLSNG